MIVSVLARRVLHLERDGAAFRGGGGHAGSGAHRDFALPERLLELGGNRFVLVRHEARQQLDDRDVAAEAIEDRRELHADGAAAHHGDRLRHFREMDRLVARDDVRLVDRDAGHAPRRRTGGDDDLLRQERAGVGAGHLDTALADQARRSFHPGDLVLLEEILDAPGETGDDLVLAGMHARHVERRLRVALTERDAPGAGLLRNLERVRMLEERLRRYAPPVEARTAERRLTLDDSDRQAELRGTNGGDIAARAGADDNDVELIQGNLANWARRGRPRAEPDTKRAWRPTNRTPGFESATCGAEPRLSTAWRSAPSRRSWRES